MQHVHASPRTTRWQFSAARVAATLLALQVSACSQERREAGVETFGSVASSAGSPAAAPPAAEGGPNGLASTSSEGAPVPAGGLGNATGEGGSVRDAGSALDASARGPSDSGTPTVTGALACPATAQLCEDFEDRNLDGWRTLPSGGTLRIDTARAFGGTAALSIDIPPNQRGGFIERTGAPLFPLPGGVLFGRVMVFFESAPDGHSDIVRGAAAGGGVPWYNVGEQHGEILLNYYNGAPSDCWARPRPGRPVALGKWTCWEWGFDTDNNRMQFWIDGQLSREVDGVGDGCVAGGNQVWAAPELATLRLGEYIAQPSALATRLWLDDVAVSTQARVGCPASP